MPQAVNLIRRLPLKSNFPSNRDEIEKATIARLPHRFIDSKHNAKRYSRVITTCVKEGKPPACVLPRHSSESRRRRDKSLFGGRKIFSFFNFPLQANENSLRCFAMIMQMLLLLLFTFSLSFRSIFVETLRRLSISPTAPAESVVDNAKCFT